MVLGEASAFSSDYNLSTPSIVFSEKVRNPLKEDFGSRKTSR